MNKRQAKKRYNKALDFTRNPNKYKDKYSAVSIVNHIFVDKNGKKCKPRQSLGMVSRMVLLKRPDIKFYKANVCAVRNG